MRVAVGQFFEPTDERLRYALQLGVGGVQMNTPRLPGEARWEFDDLRAWRERVESFGLRLEALENTPVSFYDKAMLGLPGRDEQIDNYCQTIRNMGRAGIPVLGFHWMPNSVWRTRWDVKLRGGAVTNGFDMELASREPTHGREFGEDEMWDNYEYFLRAVLPVAEEAGVRLALHPDDPPVESLGGIARLFRSFDGFRRGMELVQSPNLGLDFCVGSWSEMDPQASGPDGSGVIGSIDHFARAGKIFYVHFRDVSGHVPQFHENFLGAGNLDPVEVILTLKQCGFDGFMIDDHVPRMEDDSDWHHRGRAHATGYLLGLLAALERLG